MRRLNHIAVLAGGVAALLPSSLLALSSVKLAWDPSPGPWVVGYRVFYGVASHTYTNVLPIGNLTQMTIGGLTEGATYYFAATAVDRAGLQSEFSNEISYAVPALLSLQTNGLGRILPELLRQDPTLGRVYALTAIPGAGQLFAGWSGSLTSSAPTIRFTLQTNALLQANFILNPYPPVQGTYSGLFHEDDAVRPERAGAVSLYVSSRGSYSGSLTLGARHLAFSGLLDLQCQASCLLHLDSSNALTLQLRVGGTGYPDQIAGFVSGASWAAPLWGERSAPSSPPNPCAGAYTLVFPGQDEDSSRPAGDGYATVRVSASGLATLAGRLADGTPASQSASLSSHGLWPLYVPLYSARGCLLSWLAFTNQPDSDINGLLSWIKPANPAVAYYPAGLTNQCPVIGSAYVRPTGSNPVLNLPVARLVFSAGNLAADFTNLVAFGPNGRITNLSPNALSLAFSPPTGAFNGSVVEPSTGKSLSFSGAVLQKISSGYGFLLGTNQSSRVSLLP